MGFDDMFKPYSPELRGDLEDYLRAHDGLSADNIFQGPEYFFIIKDKGLMVPRWTAIRVGQSPIPDLYYFVNENFMLESSGRGSENMSCVGAEAGIYDPNVALKDRIWSILHLRFPEK